LCPWKGCVHVYWTWTAKSLWSHFQTFYFVFMIATQTFFPISRKQQQSFYLRLPWSRLWQGWVPWLLKGLGIGSVRKWSAYWNAMNIKAGKVAWGSLPPSTNWLMTVGSIFHEPSMSICHASVGILYLV